MVSCVAVLVKLSREPLCVSVKSTLVCSLSAHGKVCRAWAVRLLASDVTHRRYPFAGIRRAA